MNVRWVSGGKKSRERPVRKTGLDFERSRDSVALKFMPSSGCAEVSAPGREHVGVRE